MSPHGRSPSGWPAEQMLSAGHQMIDAVASADTVVRLMGGVGIAAISPTARGPLARRYHDVDLVGLRRGAREIQRVMRDLGYLPNERFNTVQGASRLLFAHMENGMKVDVFLGDVDMCHRIDLRDRLELAPVSLSPSDLFLTKMQVIELNRKDANDVLALLNDIPLGESDETLSVPYLRRLTTRDWGLYRTIELNLERLEAAVVELPTEQGTRAGQRVRQLRGALADAPKSARWRLRALVGDRLRWYRLPEEAVRTTP